MKKICMNGTIKIVNSNPIYGLSLSLPIKIEYFDHIKRYKNSIYNHFCILFYTLHLYDSLHHFFNMK